MFQTFKKDFLPGLSSMLAIYMAIFILASCASGEKHEEQAHEAAQPVSQKISPDAGASIESKQVAAESNAPFVTEVKFAKGKSELSAEMRSRLDKLWNQATSVGEIKDIDSYAWSDKEYPDTETVALSDADRTLAVSRNETIAAYFVQLGSKTKINAVTMTERPSGLNKSLSLGDTRAKKLFAEAGIPSGAQNKTAAPKKSKAVVMITLKK